jgi:hypothetical protein
MPPIRDPSADFQDDGGTPQWRARHAPQITVYKSRRDAWRELVRRQPLIGLHLGIILAIGLYLFFLVEFAGFLIYGLICRLVGYE